jgi:hypothetical protein
MNRCAHQTLGSRIQLVVLTALYAFATNVGHSLYLSQMWGYYGFPYIENVWPFLFGFTLAVSVSLFLPVSLDKPSSTIIVLLFVVVYVPTVIITPNLRIDAIERYGDLLLSMTFAMVLACLASRLRMSSDNKQVVFKPSRVVAYTFLVVWLISTALLLLSHGGAIRLVGLDEIYEQRALGTATSGVMAYIQTYYAGVVSPALIVTGLVLRRRLFIVAGVLGCLLIYSITAQRTVFLMPVAIYAIYIIVRDGSARKYASSIIVFGATSVIGVSLACYFLIAKTNPLSVYLHFRTLGLPGIMLSQYYDYFKEVGYTFWSNVKIINLLISPPQALSENPLWPNLGYLLGEGVYDNPANNHNANLFASDGAAAAGPFGILVVGMVLSLWLVVLDRAASSWYPPFSALAVVPIALSLTNAALPTTLLSFGGIFWVLAFFVFSPNRQLINRKKFIDG